MSSAEKFVLLQVVHGIHHAPKAVPVVPEIARDMDKKGTQIAEKLSAS